MHAMLDIGGGFTKRIEIPEPISVYHVISSGPMPRTVACRLDHYDERSDTAYYTVEAVTNRGGEPHEISVARGRYVA